jgi:hypothetical protein
MGLRRPGAPKVPAVLAAVRQEEDQQNTFPADVPS